MLGNLLKMFPQKVKALFNATIRGKHLLKTIERNTGQCQKNALMEYVDQLHTFHGGYRAAEKIFKRGV